MKTKSAEIDGTAEPLVSLLHRTDQWSKNGEIVHAIGWVDARGNKSVTGHWKDLEEWLGPEDTKLAPSDGDSGHEVRYFNKRAVILIGMRATTSNAKAFQRWIATTIMSSIQEPRELAKREKEALVSSVANAVRAVLDDMVVRPPAE